MRFVLFSFAILGVAACAPGGENSDGRNSTPVGYELALAKGENPATADVYEPEVVDLTADQLRARLDEGDIRLIDVRTDEEVAEGMIPGAEHIALDTFDPATLQLDDRDVIIYCRSGRRSAIAAKRLSAFTGKPAEHLEGGIIAWEQSGEPIE